MEACEICCRNYNSCDFWFKKTVDYMYSIGLIFRVYRNWRKIAINGKIIMFNTDGNELKRKGYKIKFSLSDGELDKNFEKNILNMLNLFVAKGDTNGKEGN